LFLLLLLLLLLLLQALSTRDDAMKTGNRTHSRPQQDVEAGVDNVHNDLLNLPICFVDV